MRDNIDHLGPVPLPDGWQLCALSINGEPGRVTSPVGLQQVSGPEP
ncbi:hypothetical protein [Streptomyces zaehneri]|nr:hypothetical protein [Streptomyces sp. DSM 40713]